MLRSFAVRSDNSYIAMLGGLARVNDESTTRVRWSPLLMAGSPRTSGSSAGSRSRLWIAPPRRLTEAAGDLVPTVSSSAAMVPRVLSDMFWFGRYAERAEDLLRLILAARTVAIETDRDTTQGQALES